MKHVQRLIFVIAVTLFAVFASSCGGNRELSPAVDRVCQLLDKATADVSETGSLEALRKVSNQYDEALAKYKDDNTELTDNDRAALKQSMTSFVSAMADRFKALANVPARRRGELITTIDNQKKDNLVLIDTNLAKAKTLGEFIVAR